jgi:hypothetical protein
MGRSFDRIELIDGLPHAFVKVQSPGNHTSNRSDDGNWLASALISLEGSAAGLVSRGELQELVFFSSDDSVVATQRQVSFTMQRAHPKQHDLTHLDPQARLYEEGRWSSQTARATSVPQAAVNDGQGTVMAEQVRRLGRRLDLSRAGRRSRRDGM